MLKFIYKVYMYVFSRTQKLKKEGMFEKFKHSLSFRALQE